MKKESKKRVLILFLIVFLLALVVGYAAFSDTLTISGTANVKGSFDVQFLSAGCMYLDYVGCAEPVVSVGNEASGSNVTNDKLSVTVSDLAYPGAGARIQAQIKNVGTIPATITGVTATPTGNGGAIVVHGLEALSTSHQVLQPNGTCTFDFTIMWDPSSTSLDSSKAGEDISDSTNQYTFDFVVTYEQSTTNLNVTGAYQHNDVNPATP